MEKVYCIADAVKHSFFDSVFYNYRGHIKVDDDGWFEGYVKQVGYTSLNFIFGIYHSGEILDLYYCSDVPNVFHGKLDKNTFIGTLDKLGHKEISDFDHNISFSGGKITEEMLNKKIAYAKGKMSSACLDFYSRTYEARKELNELLVKTYVGVSFNDDDKKKARDINNKKREARHMQKKLNMRG